ncbi:MAG: hypothetical protein J0H44_08415 [Alphaproteobacteria bacterium]|nr:hypothetical protein [Alphaproteobacteria bacterium]
MAVIEANGATSLVLDGDNFFFYPTGGSAGPQLSYGGSLVTLGQFVGWTPIAVEATAGGYQVIWKNGSQYSGWNTDANGNYLSNSFTTVSGTSYALESRETTLQQDLNGDGTTGLTTTVIEANGGTSLVQIADRYAFGGPSGPQLSYGGSPYIAGQVAGWTPIAVEQAANGYRVAWKNSGTNQYTVWNTDTNGNYISSAFGAVSGSSAALQSLEPGFQQDLNGDGSIAPVTTLEANGSTSLVQIAGAYLLGGPSGPQLSYGGSPVTVGGSWTPISAERAANGYAVAWKLSGVGEYTVWNTDAYGNYVSSTGVLFGQSSGLEAYEPFMHQDLNGDGTLGVPTSMFNISVNYSGDPNYRFVFDQAAARWEQVVTGVTNMPGYYDNVQISASVGPIDGPGRILGQAGPTALVDGVPSAGIMQFDSADLASMYANGTLYYVILHEMGHVLGIGSLWNYDGLTSGSGYFGQNALNAYRLLTGNPYATSVPVETQGGQGTAGVHWSEAAFGNELMTGYIAGAPDPLSIVTVGSLQDLGYRVNYSAADPYNLPGYGGSAVESSSLQANALQGSNGSSGQPIGDVAVLTQSISSTFATSTSAATGITTMIPPPETLLAKPIG